MSTPGRVVALLGAVVVAGLALALTGGGERSEPAAAPSTAPSTTTTFPRPTTSAGPPVPYVWRPPEGILAPATDDGIRPCTASDFTAALGSNEGRFGSGITLVNTAAEACRIPVDLTLLSWGRVFGRDSGGRWYDETVTVERGDPVASHYVDPAVSPGQPVGFVIQAANYGRNRPMRGEGVRFDFPDGTTLPVALVPAEYGIASSWWGPTTPWTDEDPVRCAAADMEPGVLGAAEREDGGTSVQVLLVNTGAEPCALESSLWAYAVRTLADGDEHAVRHRVLADDDGGSTVPVIANPFVAPQAAVMFRLEAEPVGDGIISSHVAIQFPTADGTAGTLIDVAPLGIGEVTRIIGPLPVTDGA